MDLHKIAEKIVDSKLTRDETIAYGKVLIREYAIEFLLNDLDDDLNYVNN